MSTVKEPETKAVREEAARVALSKTIFTRFRAIESQLAANAMDVMIPKIARESCTGSFDTYEDVMAALLKASLPMVTLQLLLDLMDAIRGGVGGPSTFLMACRANDAELVSLLLPCAGIDVNETGMPWGKTPLYVAAENDCEDVVRLLLTQDDIETEKAVTAGPDKGKTPLKIAQEKNYRNIAYRITRHPEMVALLKCRGIGIDVNKADDSGKTPLYVACELGALKVVSVLLGERVDIEIDKADIVGKTPLYIACEKFNASGSSDYLGIIHALRNHRQELFGKGGKAAAVAGESAKVADRSFSDDEYAWPPPKVTTKSGRKGGGKKKK